MCKQPLPTHNTKRQKAANDVEAEVSTQHKYKVKKGTLQVAKELKIHNKINRNSACYLKLQRNNIYPIRLEIA